MPDKPQAADEMTTDEWNKKLERSYQQSLAGEGRPVDEVFDDLEKSLS